MRERGSLRERVYKWFLRCDLSIYHALALDPRATRLCRLVEEKIRTPGLLTYVRHALRTGSVSMLHS